MIENLNSMLPSILLALDNSAFTFYPTGSRYFGGIVDATTDWDFIVEDCEEIRKFLFDKGFSHNKADNYSADITIADIFTYHRESYLDKGLIKIDIQIVHSEHLSTKLMIQKILMDRYKGKGLPGDKYTRSEIWHLMFFTLQKLNIA